MKLGFGTWRFFLAFLVVISHLWGGMIDGPAAYAVWGFFVLSGFLMTHVLSNKYGQTRVGLHDFAYNRFLRIFPAYWIACVFGAVTIFVIPRFGISPASLNPQFALPHSISDWFKNITLLPITDGGSLFVPVSGALAVEVGVYLMMPLMAFSRQATWLGLILSLALNVRYGLQSDSFPVRYSSFLTCFAVFSLGSLACHYKTTLKKFQTPLLSVLVWIGHCVIWIWYGQWPWTYGLYISALLSAWVVLSLSDQKTGSLDNILGDLSYPVYLFHTTVAVWMLLITKARSFEFFLIAFVTTLLLSCIIVLAVDNRLKQLKKRKVKHGGTVVEPNMALA